MSIEQLLCHNKIVEHLNTSDLVFSELTTHSPTLLKYLGNNIEKIFTASVTEQKEMLSHLSEHEKESVNNIIELYERQIVEAIQEIFSRLGIQLVDKEKEPFETLSPQFREFLISRGVSVQRSYSLLRKNGLIFIQESIVIKISIILNNFFLIDYMWIICT